MNIDRSNVNNANNNLINRPTTIENNGKFKKLPSEMLFKIVEYLNCGSYKALKNTNRFFYAFLSDEYCERTQINTRLNERMYNFAIRVLKTFSQDFGLVSNITTSIFTRPNTGYWSSKGPLCVADVFSNEGVLTNEHLNGKLLNKLRSMFSLRTEEFKKFNNFSEEEKNGLSRTIKILFDKFPLEFGAKRISCMQIKQLLRAIPEYQNIDLNTVSQNIETIFNNNHRNQAIYEIYQLKAVLNLINSPLDFSTEENFKFSLDNLLLADFYTYTKEVFNLFVSCRGESMLVGELFKKMVFEMTCYKNERLHQPIDNRDKNIIEIANDCLDTLEYLCPERLNSIPQEFECIKLILDFKRNRRLAVIDRLYQKAYQESRIDSYRLDENRVDISVRKIWLIDPLGLTPNRLKEISGKLTHTTINILKDNLMQFAKTNPSTEIKQSIIALIKQCFIIGTSTLTVIPSLIDLTNKSTFEIKINNVCKILQSAPNYSTRIDSRANIQRINNAGNEVLNQLMPYPANAKKNEIESKRHEIEQINNSNLYPLLAKCFPINLSNFFSSKQRIRQYKFDLLDPNKMQDIIKELTNQIGINQTSIKFLTANNISLQQDNNLYMDPKSLCRFFRNPALFPTLARDFESIVKYFKIVMDSNCPKKVNVPIIVSFLKNLNLLDVEKVDILVNTMIESLNYRAHKFFKLFVLSLNLGSEKVLEYYELLFNFYPDSLIKINYKAPKAILLQNFIFNDVVNYENYQKVLTKLSDSKKRKLEGAETPNPKRKN